MTKEAFRKDTFENGIIAVLEEYNCLDYYEPKTSTENCLFIIEGIDFDTDEEYVLSHYMEMAPFYDMSLTMQICVVVSSALGMCNSPVTKISFMEC